MDQVQDLPCVAFQQKHLLNPAPRVNPFTPRLHIPQAKQRKQHSGLFLIACARGLVEDAQQLLDWGAQPGTADKGGLGSAHFAAAHGKQAVLAFLWSKGVEVDGEDPSK